MKQEIELLVRISNSKESALKLLDNATSKSIKKTKDIYFYNVSNSKFKPDITGRLRECLRIRLIEGETYLTYKYDHFDEHNNWLYSDENEVLVSDYNSIIDILKRQGFKELVEIKSIKHIYNYLEYEIVLEEVENLGVFVEIEYYGSQKVDALSTKKKMESVLNDIGLVIIEELNSGKPELMLRKKTKNIFISFKLSSEPDTTQLVKSIKHIEELLESLGYSTYCSINDIEYFKNHNFTEAQRINYINQKIDSSEALLLVILNAKESKGMMLELGYALAENKPIYLIKKSDLISGLEDSLSNSRLEFNKISDIDKPSISRLLKI